jgi:hypothetical protein
MRADDLFSAEPCDGTGSVELERPITPHLRSQFEIHRNFRPTNAQHRRFVWVFLPQGEESNRTDPVLGVGLWTKCPLWDVASVTFDRGDMNRTFGI